MKSLIAKLRARLAAAETGSDFIDSCCHRIGGRLRAGSPAYRPGDDVPPPSSPR